LRNEKSAYMEFILNNHYKIVYLYFSVFQLVLTNCFSILNELVDKQLVSVCIK